MITQASAHMPVVQVDVLFIRDCPTHRPMVVLVRDAANSLGIRIELREHDFSVASPAMRRRFRGSPTVLINGRDFELDGGDHGGSHAESCRIYREGALPSYESVLDALTRAARPA